MSSINECIISSSFGYLFEISFNIGILTYIKQKQIKHNYGDMYVKDTQLLRFKQIKANIITQHKIKNPEHIKSVEQWSLFYLQKGFLSGYNFIREYLDSLNAQLSKLEIHYLQCNFSGNNSFALNPKGEKQIFSEVLQQLTKEYVDINHYKDTGEFLRADTLMLIKNGRRECRILSLDASVFSVRSLQDLKDLTDIEVIRDMMSKEINYLKSKSVFANLSIDTGGEEQSIDISLNEKLGTYLAAFIRKDKESYKLIQAGSYAYSFYGFLRSIEVISPEDKVIFNIIGYTDRGVSAMCVHLNNLDFLKTCQSIYQQKPNEKDNLEPRKRLVSIITRNAKESFAPNSSLFQSLAKLSVNQNDPITYQENITGFLNPKENVPQYILEEVGLTGEMSLRHAHSTLVEQALESNKTYVFLTGNPGIGKTTALVSFLEKHFEEGFLFLYVSPRKQVNLDIINKFEEIKDKEKREQVFAVNTDSQIIKSNGGKATVQYSSGVTKEHFSSGGVQFIDANIVTESKTKVNYRLKQAKEDLIIDAGSNSTGVMNSLSKAVRVLIESDISRQMVAAFSIQALKKTKKGGDTLAHF